MNNFKYIFILLGLAMVFSCTKPPEYPDEPTLTFKSSSNFFSQNLNDTISITFEFTDGDGDLGTDDNVIFDLLFTDLRDGSQTIQRSLPKVPEQGANNGISGEISVFLTPFNALCCIFPDGTPICGTSPDFPVDTLQYEVVLMDRDSNFSEPVVTDPIIMICD